MHLSREAKQRIVVEQLISDFALSLNGSVDIWTAVSLGFIPVAGRDFILDKADRLRCVLVVLSNIATRSCPQQHLEQTFKRMSDECQQYTEAFLVLERNRTSDFPEFRTAIDTIRKNYLVLRADVEQIVAALKLEPPDALTMSSERQAYFDRNLNGLLEPARMEHATAVAAVSTLA